MKDILRNYKMNGIKTVFLISIFLLNSCHKYNKGHNIKNTKHESSTVIIPKIFYGEFSAVTNTEETTTGTASISYNFAITKSGAILSTESYHEPIRCNGKYEVKLNVDILELFYAGTEQNCKSDHPTFKIKKSDQNLFVQGLGGEATFNEWIELKQK
ncbi:hypothetical protein [Kaistella carnis]|uniref:Uncharacterized protein n=1 Tax=Kaistella carnis TaxID=1241979 RepID=A0A3G8XI11_9FLAO|nr:hypothetical protein [Kaistella carnis]AZI33135.1 hypothetical protein EIB73_08080 [Kaistella carnis]